MPTIFAETTCCSATADNHPQAQKHLLLALVRNCTASCQPWINTSMAFPHNVHTIQNWQKKAPPLHTYRIEYCICFCLFGFLTCTAGLCLAACWKKAFGKLLLNGATAWLHLVVLWSKCGGAESQIYSIFHIISHPHETSSIQSRSSDWLAAYCWIFLLVLFACCWICLLLSLSFCGQNAMVPRANYIAFSI